MPPQSPILNPNEDRLLPRPSEASREGAAPTQRSGIGPVVGIVIIVALLVIGALYFWGAHLETQAQRQQPLPYIPEGDTTSIQYSTTTSPR
jgi:hypothetical protein